VAAQGSGDGDDPRTSSPRRPLSGSAAWRLPRRLAVSLLLFLAACTGDSLGPGPRSITVLTQNLYLGAALAPVLSATPAQLPQAVAQAFAQVQATNFAERAGRLAQEIAATRPDVIGLQEVALYRRQSPGDAISGGTTPATTVVLDFLEILRDSLAARGLGYVAVATHTGLDLEAPMSTGTGQSGPTYDDLRFTDRDVILASGVVTTSHPSAADFVAKASVTTGGVTIFIPRGWTSVETAVGSSVMRIVNTHLEIEAAAPFQVAQAQELIDLLRPETQPVLLIGDFNSAANVLTTQSYGLLTSAGFHDAWLARHPTDSGPTCCQASDLLNATSTLDQRVDFVFWRGPVVSVSRVDVIGDGQADRTTTGLWPSDHAGVVATLTVR
jgi:endonuclease/exonuclease/phosphatase family metal-dependent hydrolase